MSASILLVEDDPNLGFILKEYLEIHGMQVVLSSDGEAGLQAFKDGTYDLCILDIMLPKKDGYTLASEIKHIDPAIPFVFLTAKALKTDKLKGFRLGCDDFVVKPIDEELFIARIRAILKRTSNGERTNGKYQLGHYLFDSANQALEYNGKIQRLTEKESKVLQMLCDRKNEVLDRKKALKTIWGQNDVFNRKSMDVFIHKLRKYLEHDTSIRITNVHGKGFILQESEPD